MGPAARQQRRIERVRPGAAHNIAGGRLFVSSDVTAESNILYGTGLAIQSHFHPIVDAVGKKWDELYRRMQIAIAKERERISRIFAIKALCYQTHEVDQWPLCARRELFEARISASCDLVTLVAEFCHKLGVEGEKFKDAVTLAGWYGSYHFQTLKWPEIDSVRSRVKLCIEENPGSVTLGPRLVETGKDADGYFLIEPEELNTEEKRKEAVEKVGAAIDSNQNDHDETIEKGYRKRIVKAENSKKPIHVNDLSKYLKYGRNAWPVKHARASSIALRLERFLYLQLRLAKKNGDP